MPQIPYIFNQLVAFIPKDYFDRLVKKFSANKYVRSYTSWNHLLVMIWAQLTSRQSLRDIESSLRVHSDKTFRMGIGKSISRNNIAHASANRDVAVFRELASKMMSRACHIAVKDDILTKIAGVFGTSVFFAVDSTTVSLGLDKYPWTVSQKGWGGIKLHTMYDLLREVPRMCLVTGHEERDHPPFQDQADIPRSHPGSP